jgi:hypothetical protein
LSHIAPYLVTATVASRSSSSDGGISISNKMHSMTQNLKRGTRVSRQPALERWQPSSLADEVYCLLHASQPLPLHLLTMRVNRYVRCPHQRLGELRAC